MEKPHHYRCAAKLFDAKPFRLAAFREYRQSKYVLEHILRPSIHPHLKQQMFGFVVELQWRATQTRRGSNASLCVHSRCASDCCMQRSTSADVNYD
jgi:hypothetical protein